MNYLALIARAKVECAVPGSVPTALTGNPAEIDRIAGWVNAAWMRIQELNENWKFLRSTFSFNTVAQTASYSETAAGIAALPGLGSWKTDSFRIYLTSAGVSGEQFLSEIDYDTYRDLYQFSTYRTSYARPIAFAIDPARNIVLGYSPDAVYTVLGEYFKAPSEMTATTDIPALPTKYHMLIVYRAMMYHGVYEAAPEIYAQGAAEYASMLSAMEFDQLPEITLDVYRG